MQTARQGREVVNAEDRRIDQVVNELTRYNIDIAALQETKWFGEEAYKVGKSMMLTAGRTVPGANEVKQRGKGVALVLNGRAIDAWRTGGSKWKAWSSRLITVTLLVGSRRCNCLHILSCYAPTYGSSWEVKEQFFASLQQALSDIPSQECYVVLGDFNARVGSRRDDDEWWNVRGPHGHGDLNDADKDLLSFLSTNEATICNTWFQKKAKQKATWQHPGTKQWHCIDFTIMRQSLHKKCFDVTVMHGAQCSTDHQMIRMKLLADHTRPNKRSQVKRLKDMMYQDSKAAVWMTMGSLVPKASSKTG